MTTIYPPTPAPLRMLQQKAVNEIASRKSEEARVLAEKAACIALVSPLIAAWEDIFRAVDLSATDWSTHPKSHLLAWGDYYGRPSDDPVERYCTFEWQTAHSSHVQVFRVEGIIPSRNASPVIRVNTHNHPYRDFEDWREAFDCCANVLVPLLDTPSLAVLQATFSKKGN